MCVGWGSGGGGVGGTGGSNTYWIDSLMQLCLVFFNEVTAAVHPSNHSSAGPGSSERHQATFFNRFPSLLLQRSFSSFISVTLFPSDAFLHAAHRLRRQIKQRG